MQTTGNVFEQEERVRKAADFVAAIDAEFASLNLTEIEAQERVEAFTDAKWTALAFKAQRHCASEQTRELVRRTYRARAALFAARGRADRRCPVSAAAQTWSERRAESVAKAAAIIGETHPLDAKVRALTGFSSVLDMMGDALACGDSGYRPTCRTDMDAGYVEIADVYDASAAKLGLTKRAFRSGGFVKQRDENDYVQCHRDGCEMPCAPGELECKRHLRRARKSDLRANAIVAAAAAKEQP